MFYKFIALPLVLSSLLMSAQAFARADDTKTVPEPEAKQEREQKYFGRAIANDPAPADGVASEAPKPVVKKHRKPASDDSTQTPAEAGD